MGERELRFSFEPADVVNQVMSFGSPTPVEITVSGPDLAVNHEYAKNVHAELKKIRSLKDLQFSQVMDYPRINVMIDRERAGFAGLTMADTATAMIAATSSSRYVVPVFWADPKSGIGYQVQLQVPPLRMNSVDQVGMIPAKRLEDGGQILLRDVGRIHASTMPEEFDRLNQMRYLSLVANIEGEDLDGSVPGLIRHWLMPEKCRVAAIAVRGKVAPMLEMFHGLAVGMGLAVVVVFLLLTAYFQSVRLALWLPQPRLRRSWREWPWLYW